MQTYFTEAKTILELRRLYAQLCRKFKNDAELYHEISRQYTEATRRLEKHS